MCPVIRADREPQGEVVSAEERRRRIELPIARSMIKSARDLIGQRGVSATSLREIQANATGSRGGRVASGSVFYYFGSKEQLLVEVLHTELNSALQPLIDQAPELDSCEQFVSLWGELLESFTSSANGHAVVIALVGEALNLTGLGIAQAELYADVLRKLTGVIVRLQHREVLGDQISADRLAERLLADALGLATLKLGDPDWDDQPARDTACHVLRVLVEPRTDPPASPQAGS